MSNKNKDYDDMDDEYGFEANMLESIRGMNVQYTEIGMIGEEYLEIESKILDAYQLKDKWNKATIDQLDKALDGMGDPNIRYTIIKAYYDKEFGEDLQDMGWAAEP